MEWLELEKDKWLKATVLERLETGDHFEHACAIGLMARHRKHSNGDAKFLVSLLRSGLRMPQKEREWAKTLSLETCDALTRHAMAVKWSALEQLEECLDLHAGWEQDVVESCKARDDLGGILSLLRLTEREVTLRRGLEHFDLVAAPIILALPPVSDKDEQLIRACQTRPSVWWVSPAEKYLADEGFL